MSFDIKVHQKKNGETTYTARIRKNGVSETAKFKRKMDAKDQ